jgi:hypothetical protein
MMRRFLLLSALALTGCSAAQKKAAIDMAICSIPSIVTVINDLVPALTAMLQAGTPTWEEQIKALSVSFGKNEVACAVQAVLNSMRARDVTAAQASAVRGAIARGEQYLSDVGAK